MVQTVTTPLTTSDAIAGTIETAEAGDAVSEATPAQAFGTTPPAAGVEGQLIETIVPPAQLDQSAGAEATMSTEKSGFGSYTDGGASYDCDGNDCGQCAAKRGRTKSSGTGLACKHGQ